MHEYTEHISSYESLNHMSTRLLCNQVKDMNRRKDVESKDKKFK